MPQPQIIKTPKTYWVTKRLEGHRDWRMASWRELVQNSVDAGASRIDISIENAVGIGSWGRAPNNDTVTRVRFSDNGRGMNRGIMEEVFFSPGESTKRGDGTSVGGFGTARTILCFSHARFGIRTGSLQVEGDGSEYTIDDVPGTPRKGAEFEIDITPFENGYYNTVERMRERLDQYLSYSQIAPKVFVNGEELKTGTKKGAATCRLIAEVNGKNVEFATIHANRGERSPHKGKIIVRVQGAAMFVEEADVPFQVVVEVDPSMGRTVLLDNRDGMKWEYSRALSRFMEELNKDVRSALDKDEARKHTVVRGGMGDMVQAAIIKLRGADWGMPYADVATAALAVPASALGYLTPEKYEEQGFGGVPAPAMGAFLDQVKDGIPTFLDGWADRTEVDAFIAGVRDGGSAALGVVGQDLAAFVAAGVGLVADREGVSALMKDSHDIHIYREGLVEGEKGSDDYKLFHAARRWSPAFWRKPDHEKGTRGGGAHITLAAWTACCQHAVAYLARMSPRAVPEGGIRFSTGYAFVKARDTWNYEQERTVKSSVGALYKKVDDTHALLLNPVMNNGEAIYDLTTEGGDPSTPVKGIADMMALAWHEATHILRGPHDEEYATLLTQMMTGFARQDIQRGMRDSIREAINVTRAAYGRGECRIQALELPAPDPVQGADAPVADKVRPAKRLQTLANPATTMVLGTAVADGNEQAAGHEMPSILAYIDMCIDREKTAVDKPIVTTVNCDALSALEAGLANILLGKEPAPVALEPVEVPVPENNVDVAVDETEVELEAVQEMPVIEVAVIEVAVIDTPVVADPVIYDAPGRVDLSALDIGLTPSKVRRAPVDKPEAVDSSQILALLGQGQGRFSAPVSQAAPKGEVGAAPSTPREKIELAQGGLAGLIRRGGLAGLATRIKAAAGDTSEFPEPAAEAPPPQDALPDVAIEAGVEAGVDAGADAALVGDDFDMLDDDQPAAALVP